MSRQRNEQRGPARRRRVAAILVAAVTVCGPLALTASAGAASGVPAALAAPAAPAATGAARSATYLGWTGTVPAGWAAVDLTANPSACVRFDVHAVYLGRPGDQQSCPSHVSGRTEALLVEPVGGLTTAPLVTSPTVSVTGLPATASASQELQVAIPSAGVAVTATWSNDRAVIDRVFASGTATPGWQPTSLPQVPAPKAVTRSAAATFATEQFVGQAFDACTAPSTRTMTTWLASPYRAVGVYIGGVNRGCSQTNLTANWVSAVAAQGWQLIPIYVGRQAPAPPCNCQAIDAAQASAQGRTAAEDAVIDAKALGITPGAPLFNDMESYSRTASNIKGVVTFLSAWTDRLHQLGYRSGVYSGADTGIRDLGAAASTITIPDVVWYAVWDGRNTTVGNTWVPAGRWDHQRLHQYATGSQTWGGLTLDIDRSAVDAPLFGPAKTPPPPPPLPPPPPPPVPTPSVRTEQASALVARAYAVALDRRPTTDEANFWTWCISGGASRTDFMGTLLGSPEWAARKVSVNFFAVLHRLPDAAGASYWTRWMSNHHQPDVMAAILAASDERWNQSGANRTNYVHDLYLSLLGREADDAGALFWTVKLESGTSRASFALSLATGRERINRFVTAAYWGVLNRAPDPAGSAHWSSVYGVTHQPASVLVPLAGSAEAVAYG